LKDKLRRAAQFSGAGLVVPEELSLFKKDGYQKDSGSSEASEEVFPRKFVDSTYAKECNRNLTGRKSKNGIENDAMKEVECERMIDIGMSNPEPETEGTLDLFDVLDSTIKPSVPSSSCEEIDMQVNYIFTCFCSPHHLGDFCKIFFSRTRRRVAYLRNIGRRFFVKYWIYLFPSDIASRGCCTYIRVYSFITLLFW